MAKFFNRNSNAESPESRNNSAKKRISLFVGGIACAAAGSKLGSTEIGYNHPYILIPIMGSSALMVFCSMFGNLKRKGGPDKGFDGWGDDGWTPPEQPMPNDPGGLKIDLSTHGISEADIDRLHQGVRQLLEEKVPVSK